MKKRLYLMGLSLIVLALLFSVAGCQGERGSEGLQGAQGIQGVQGNPGTTGAVGPQGAKGDTGEPGTPITWMGTATSAPKSWRVLNYAYYNSTHKTSYIWDGNSWEILAKDGYDGATGATGPRGYTGATGPQGEQGAPGPQGEQGPAGPVGPQGLPGQDCDPEILQNLQSQIDALEARLDVLEFVPLIIDGVISPGEWDGATVIPVAGDMGTVSIIAYTDYLYVLFDVTDSDDARLGQTFGNDQTSININPTVGVPWGTPCDIIFQMGADPDAWDGISSGTTDDWETDWKLDGVQQMSLPGDLATMTLYSGGTRISEWKIPLASIAPSPGDTLRVAGAIDVGDQDSHVYPVDLDWIDASTYVDILVR